MSTIDINVTDRQTDERTDRQTDRPTDNLTWKYRAIAQQKGSHGMKR